MKHVRTAALALPLLATAACDSDSVQGSGKVRVLVTAEETITEGLSAGDGDEQTRDYGVTYDKYLVVVGHVALGRGGEEQHDEGQYVLDMKRVGDEGVEITVFDDVPAGQWSEFGFETPAAEADAQARAGVSDDDLAEMVEGGYTYWIEGTVERPEDEGGPVKFSIRTDAPTVYSGCELDGQPGVAVKADSTSAATITLHGDHLWFDGFPVGEEGKIERRAKWITLVEDVEGDGVIDTEDLRAADPTVVLAGYDLSGNPGGTDHPIDSVLEYARQQLATQGHYKGEGECAWAFEGVEGDHDHARVLTGSAAR